MIVVLGLDVDEELFGSHLCRGLMLGRLVGARLSTRRGDVAAPRRRLRLRWGRCTRSETSGLSTERAAGRQRRTRAPRSDTQVRSPPLGLPRRTEPQTGNTRPHKFPERQHETLAHVPRGNSRDSRSRHSRNEVRKAARKGNHAWPRAAGLTMVRHTLTMVSFRHRGIPCGIDSRIV